MSFQSWLKKEHGKTWEELFCKVDDLTLIQYAKDYETYCYNKNIQPIWVD